MSIYHDIVETIIKDIQNGTLKKGSKLPSIRQLSQTYACSKDTAQRALLELKYQNYIYAVPKSGYYVLEVVMKLIIRCFLTLTITINWPTRILNFVWMKVWRVTRTTSSTIIMNKPDSKICLKP